MDNFPNPNSRCNEVTNMLVDYCEDTLQDAVALDIEKHLSVCSECGSQYLLTKGLINKKSKAG